MQNRGRAPLKPLNLIHPISLNKPGKLDKLDTPGRINKARRALPSILACVRSMSCRCIFQNQQEAYPLNSRFESQILLTMKFRPTA